MSFRRWTRRADLAVQRAAQAVARGGRLRLETESRSSRLEESARDLWLQLDVTHDHQVAARPIAGADDPAAPEDVVVSFTRSDSANEAGPRHSISKCR